jgi:hypothetical protein
MGSAPTFTLCAFLVYESLFQQRDTNIFVGHKTKFFAIKSAFLSYLKTSLLRTLQVLFLCFFLRSQFDIFYQKVKGAFPKNALKSETPLWDCQKLIQRNPNIPWNLVFVTRYEDCPALGLCVGVRTNGKGREYGLFSKNEMPAHWNIVDMQGNIFLALDPEFSKHQIKF